jgi:hypothetical protein
MAERRNSRCNKKGTSHLRLVESVAVKGPDEFRNWTFAVLDLPVLTVLSADDEEYAADVARLVARG